MQVFIGINIKWFIRIALIIFWIPTLYLTFTGQGFVTWLITNHTWITITILTLTFYFLLGPFYAPFVTIKTKGGENVMQRSTKILVFLAALLGALVVAMSIEQSRTVILNAFSTGFLAPIGSGVGGFNLWLKSFEPLHIVGAGLLGGLLLAVATNMFVRPRIQRMRQTTAKDYGGAPVYIPPKNINTTSTNINPSPAVKKKVVTTEEIIEEEATV